MSSFTVLDYVIFAAYACIILFAGWFVSRKKDGETRNSQDYFLASKSLAWWAIGASIIASNVSAEQFIGMSGSGFAIGLGIASYEFLAAAALIVVAIFFLPIYLKANIYTMPQFLEFRYDKRVKTIMAFFWLLVFIFVNLTSILYLGALALKEILGIEMLTSIICLALFAGLYSIYGGLKAVAMTDIIRCNSGMQKNGLLEMLDPEVILRRVGDAVNPDLLDLRRDRDLGDILGALVTVAAPMIYNGLQSGGDAATREHLENVLQIFERGMARKAAPQIENKETANHGN